MAGKAENRFNDGKICLAWESCKTIADLNVDDRFEGAIGHPNGSVGCKTKFKQKFHQVVVGQIKGSNHARLAHKQHGKHRSVDFAHQVKDTDETHTDAVHQVLDLVAQAGDKVFYTRKEIGKHSTNTHGGVHNFGQDLLEGAKNAVNGNKNFGGFCIKDTLDTEVEIVYGVIAK
jgi:hypothetical protein